MKTLPHPIVPPTLIVVAAALALVPLTTTAQAESNFTNRVLSALHLTSVQTPAAPPRELPAETSVLKPPTITGAPTIEYEEPSTAPTTAPPTAAPEPATVPQAAVPQTTSPPTATGPGVTVWRPAPVQTYFQPPAVVYRPAPVYQPVYRPIVPLARPPKTYVVGRGALGQPKVYVPAQPVRNILRWISP